MRRSRFRSIPGWLGLLTCLGSLGAHAESEPCACHPENPRAVTPASCLSVNLFWSCESARIHNGCSTPVELRGWPLEGCTSASCDLTLRPNGEAFFRFPVGMTPARTEEASYPIVFEGREARVELSAEVVCEDKPVSTGGCTSATTATGVSGALLLLLGPWARGRRRA